MRSLTINEMNAVSGADYSDDILTAAATIYVGSAIGSVATGLTHVAFATAASLTSSIGPLSGAFTMIGTVAAPVMYFYAPVAVFEAVYPGVLAEKAAQYF